jgi:hypothetical protein
MVRRYSSAPRIEQALKAKMLREKIVLSTIQSIGLIASGGLGMGAAVVDTTLDIGTAAFNVVLNSYISIVSLVMSGRRDVDHITGDLTDMLKYSLNEYTHQRAVNIDDDIRDLTYGGKNSQGSTVHDLFMKYNFLKHEPMLQEMLRITEERWMFAVHVNAIWHFDRPYILDVNAPYWGGCESDYRGAVEYRVCLPEFPRKSVRNPVV